MSYIPGYKYDIFISYAHVDNETISKQNIGLIEEFYKNLNLLLVKRIGKMDVLNFWWDTKKLDGGQLFNQTIDEAVRQSAIMLCMLSPGYLASPYCKQELNLFYKKTQEEPIGLKIGDRPRLFNILLNNIHFSEWPVELSGISGFPFHDGDTKEKDDPGDPLDAQNPEFRIQLEKLRDSILNIFKDILKAQSAPVLPNPQPEKTEGGFTIFMGEVADSLRTVRKRTITDLEKKGYRVVYGIPPPDEAGLHENKVKEELVHADLAVHLLDQYPGKEIVGNEDNWYPKKQAELSLEFSKSKLIWVPAEMDIEAVEEDKFKSFIKELETGVQSAGKYDYIRGAKSTISQEIIDLAEQLKMAKQPPPVKGKISVLLDTHFNDQLYAMDLGKTLLENQIQPFINPQEDDPRKNINLLAERISQVSKLIFFYGKVSHEWVLERMSAALQLIVTNNFQVDDFYIYLAPPFKDPNEISMKQRVLKVNVIDNSGNDQLNADKIQLLLKGLKGELL